MFKLYNGCPNRELQDHLNSIQAKRDHLTRVAMSKGHEARITYYPHGSYYCGFIVGEAHELVTGDCQSFDACYHLVLTTLLERGYFEAFTLPDSIIESARSIAHQNHDITNPMSYNKVRLSNLEFERLLRNLFPDSQVDYVLFSSESGAEEHTDVHLKHLDIYTQIIPIIIDGQAVLHYRGKAYELRTGQPILINHQLPHSITTKDSSALVLCMASKIID